MFEPLSRFTGLAEIYARCRPGYPEAAVRFILDTCGLGPGSVLVDVGCGTGISARRFAAQGLKVIGIEPNDEMRRKAEAESPPEEAAALNYRKGTGEATGLADGVADAVLAAQAFHWFQPEAALREFHRILRPAGWVALVWNERDEADPFTASVGAAIRAVPGSQSIEGPRQQSGNALLESVWFAQARRAVFPNEQELDEDGLIGRVFSASYAPREPAAAATLAAALREAFARFQHNGRACLRYETSVYVGQRKE